MPVAKKAVATTNSVSKTATSTVAEGGVSIMILVRITLETVGRKTQVSLTVLQFSRQKWPLILRH